MNKSNARQYIPLIEALADGELEFNNHMLHSPNWLHCIQSDFSSPPEYYRRKPKPTVVPWTLDTCPVGAVVKSRITGSRMTILLAEREGITMIPLGRVSYECMFTEYTVDNGAACGVVQS